MSYIHHRYATDSTGYIEHKAIATQPVGCTSCIKWSNSAFASPSYLAYSSYQDSAVLEYDAISSIQFHNFLWLGIIPRPCLGGGY